MKKTLFVLVTLVFSLNAYAVEDSTVDAAIGGGIGGAVGAAIGNEIGGKEGAIIGGAIGGGAGAAIGVDEKPSTQSQVVIQPAPKQKFCPPGQAKKGNC